MVVGIRSFAAGRAPLPCVEAPPCYARTERLQPSAVRLVRDALTISPRVFDTGVPGSEEPAFSTTATATTSNARRSPSKV
jgi:hypothetical protein